MKNLLFALGFVITGFLVMVSPSVNAASEVNYSVPAISVDTVVSFEAPVERSFILPTVFYYFEASGGGNYTRDWVLSQTTFRHLSTRPAHNGYHNTWHAVHAKEGTGNASRTWSEHTSDRNLWPTIYQV